MNVAGRIAAAGIAAIAWLGLIVQFAAIYRGNPSLSHTLWIMFGFFTITTNTLVAAVFTAIAAQRTALRSDWVLAGTMLSILLVGIVYGLLLHGTMTLSGGAAIANVLTHMVVPALVPLFWIVFAPKGGLNWRHPLLWAIYPLAYLSYDMTRGAITGSFAYPFLNAVTLGWQQTTLHALYIAAIFLLSSFALVGIDGWIGGWTDNRLGSPSAQ